MSWIEQINKNQATGKLKDIYDEIERKRGKLSNVMRVQSLNPEVMRTHLDLYLSIMFGDSELSRQERELIAVVVSSVNNCSYCIKHHAQALLYYWKDEKRIEKILVDYHDGDLSEKHVIMLDYVVKLTKNPDMISKSDIDSLKKKGFLDRTILDVNLIASYFNLVNRIVLGLGVGFSSDEIRGYQY